jgi:hypothetical protein
LSSQDPALLISIDACRPTVNSASGGATPPHPPLLEALMMDRLAEIHRFTIALILHNVSWFSGRKDARRGSSLNDGAIFTPKRIVPCNKMQMNIQVVEPSVYSAMVSP